MRNQTILALALLAYPLAACGADNSNGATDTGASAQATDTTPLPGAAETSAATPNTAAPADPATAPGPAIPPGTATATTPATSSDLPPAEPGTSNTAPATQPSTTATDVSAPSTTAAPSIPTVPDSPAATGCTITSNATVSEAIQTVGIVTFSADVPQIDEAHIDFGLDTTYGMTAPVDLAEPEHRTLLLGMKTLRDYHYQIVVKSGDQQCTSGDLVLTTGPLPNFVPDLSVNTVQPDKLYGGFFMTGQYESRGGPTSPAYIIDKDGDYVWALAVGDYVTGVRMSYDGKHMWINGTDNTSGGKANIHRVSMDGLEDEDLSEEFGLQDHSITVLPDESVIFYGHDATQCAEIKRRYLDGRIEPIINIGDAHMVPGACHVNAVEYSPEDETLIFSDDNHNNYTKVTLDGQVVWVLGGETSWFTGDGSQWEREHGIDVLGLDSFLFFNNGPVGSATGSIAIQVQLDLVNMTSTRVWTYGATPTLYNQVLGDVQRMENGNTIVAFSAQGVVNEVDADGNLVQEIAWPLGGAFGYIVKRKTLYGPPPR